MEITHVMAIVGSNILIALASIGATITLFLWARGEAEANRREASDILKAIDLEIKDFHTRLLKIEMEKK